MLEDHGVEEPDDGFLVVGVEAFEGAEAVEQARAVQRYALGGIAGTSARNSSVNCMISGEALDYHEIMDVAEGMFGNG